MEEGSIGMKFHFWASKAPAPSASPGEVAAWAPAELETGPVSELLCHAAASVV